MPWKEVSIMEAREEFVSLAIKEGANVRELCRRYSISQTTAYKWLGRYAQSGRSGLADRSRRPLNSPERIAPSVESRVVALRQQHPKWGARKLRRRLQDLGEKNLPSVSTVHTILRRHGLIDATEGAKHSPFVRFEHDAPNAFWQMDFKGHFALTQGRCHPLTVLDDHSRYNLCLQACANEQGLTVQAQLCAVFGRYGLPLRIGVDNGSPWGDTVGSPYTPLTVWLIRLGVRVSHSRPYHPQTLGKDERFHRSLKLEVLQGEPFENLPQAQTRFDAWRHCYNHERPHEALGMHTPASRYLCSPRSFPQTLPAIEYADPRNVRQVQHGGDIHYRGHTFSVSKAFHRQSVAVRPNASEDGLIEIFFCHQKIASFNLTQQR
jgi:transposase InsO family protein